ncbi:MAG: patatin family protein [Bacilli bacterium]|nr:patatin family protein [Bacilli bacterium]
MSEKIAIVLQGGGTRSAFTAGVLDVLMEEGISFPYVIGTSAGALSAINLLSGDKGRSYLVVTELMTDPRFASLHNFLFKGSFFNFPYLFIDVPKKKIPFNRKAYQESPIRFIAATSDLETGEARYFEKGVCKSFDKAVAASSSLPLLTKKPVMVEGHPCIDGGTFANVPFRKPLEDGMERIVVVTTRPRGFRKGAHSAKSIRRVKKMYKDYPSFVESYPKEGEIYNRDMEDLELLEKEGKAFIIEPQRALPIGRITLSKKKLKEAYDMGTESAKEALSKLKEFMEI